MEVPVPGRSYFLAVPADGGSYPRKLLLQSPLFSPWVPPWVLRSSPAVASKASIWLSVVASLAPWGTYLEDGGGVSDLCRDSSLILLRTLLAIFSLLFLFLVPGGLYLFYLF